VSIFALGAIVVGAIVLYVVLGFLSIIAGVLAILNPFPASFVAVKLAGWAFLIIGGLQIIEAFRAMGWGGRIWALAIGVLALIAGINPVAVDTVAGRLAGIPRRVGYDTDGRGLLLTDPIAETAASREQHHVENTWPHLTKLSTR